MGQNRHLLTYPTNHGTTLSMVAFATNHLEDWPSKDHLILPTTKAEALDDFREFGQNVKNIIQLANDNLDRVSPTDLPMEGMYARILTCPSTSGVFLI